MYVCCIKGLVLLCFTCLYIECVRRDVELVHEAVFIGGGN